MSNEVRILLELGPKGKKHAAFAPDWPGLSRGAKTPEGAVDRVIEYLPRYAPIAHLAGFGDEFDRIDRAGEIVEVPGTPSTDYWAISFGISDFDREPMSQADLDRDLALLRACWTFFDAVAERVSDDLRKGPRGGGRDKDHLIRHTLFAEQEWRTAVGFPKPERSLVEPEEREAGRAAFLEAIRRYHAEGKSAGKSPLRRLIRHSAYHTLDHAWEMEDRDLTGQT